ncbi:MAG TPA: TetR/AcrR family transcriptional regulator [Pseudonocardia sp.]|jgi:AcrR family transcriptional regulator
MSPERSGAGDPARTLALLWRDPATVPSRGPRRGLDVDRLVDTAIGLADRGGLEAVSVRRLAEALRVAPMTVYTYVPGKAELLDLMLDSAYARMPRAGTEGQPWRARLSAVAEENRSLLTDHPWIGAVSTLRPTLGPGAIGKYEHELAALDGLGLSDVEMDDCLTHLLAFVESNARAAADAQATRRDTAMDDREWWDRAGPVLARYLGDGGVGAVEGGGTRYPLAVRVGAAAGSSRGSAHDPEHAYRFGLGRVLDGLAVLIDTGLPDTGLIHTAPVDPTHAESAPVDRA